MKKNNDTKIVAWIIVVIALLMILIGIVYYFLVLVVNSDSERIIENQLKENGFNASKYPVVINKTEYPELSAFEKEISEEYETMLQDFYEEFYKGHEYECFLSPSFSKLNFTHLKPKQNLYMIESYCGVPWDTRSAVISGVFYVNQGNIVMFYKKDVASHFTEAFNNIENLNQLKEYSELYVGNLAIDLNSALNNSVFQDSSPEDFKKDCPLISDIPELTSTVSKEGNGFVYEGLKIEEELHASLYYLKYNITSDGQVVKDKEEMLAVCEKIGVIY